MASRTFHRKTVYLAEKGHEAIKAFICSHSSYRLPASVAVVLSWVLLQAWQKQKRGGNRTPEWLHTVLQAEWLHTALQEDKLSCCEVR